MAAEHGRTAYWKTSNIGRVIYNKSRKLRHPDTGKRVDRPNPPNEWKTFRGLGAADYRR
jgi:hypothetical protein